MVRATKDFDAPRDKGSIEPEADSLEELQFQARSSQTAVIDVDYGEGFDLPDDDTMIPAEVFSEDDLAPVIPMQASEFRCSRCFLAHPIRRRAYNRNNEPVCTDCA